MQIKLGVNIDHVATLRQARQEMDPDPVVAARIARGAGADLIVAHLRQDRRHVVERDLQELRKLLKTGLHLELANVPEMIRIGLSVRPDWICIVPESPDEVTTQGGLSLKADKAAALEKTIKQIKRAGVGVSLFVDPEALGVRMAHNLGADAVELCTAEYASAVGKHHQTTELEKLELAGYLAHELKLELHAGHGLDYTNVVPVAQIPDMACLNIGFSIVSRSIFTGFKLAVAEMKKLVSSVG
ncbi:MAG TPA: pyridoxine 5'-phosphate synthase [Elusimicrobia bacterium]|nr:pyridoxine 5'-phosphate synthase [Elusimicrobiota bacterium]